MRALAEVPVPVEGLAASPRGRYVALAAGPRGLWLLDADGTHLRRIAPTPHPAVGGGTLAILATAWSPDRYTLAYLVGAGNATRPWSRNADIWTIRYNGGTSRHLTRVVIPTDSASWPSLSWTNDGRAIVTTTGAGAVAIEATAGRARVLARNTDEANNVQAAVAAPATPALCYVRLAVGSMAADYTLYTADSAGRHARRLLTVSNTIASPAWAPDGRSVASLWQRGITSGESGDQPSFT